MQQWLQLLFMAFVQGVTEFLPVSSSGHLIVLSRIFGMDPSCGLTAGIFLHGGSLLAIIVFYFKLLCGFLKKEQLPLLLKLICGTLPVAVGGVLIKSAGFADAVMADPLVAGMAFLVTGMLLRLTGKKKMLPPEENTVELDQLSFRQAFVIGLVQLGAVLPGISRSGSTISAGLFCGIKREAAAAFSFLLAIPAIAGAALWETVKLAAGSETQNIPFTPFQLAGAVVFSFLVSLGALHFMVNVVKKSRLSAFSWYLFILGAGVLIWQFSLLNGAK